MDIEEILQLRDEITEAHKELFPLATEQGQYQHLVSEYKEMQEAYREYTITKDEWDYNHYVEEASDVFIVLCGINRFNPIMAELLWNGFKPLIESIYYKTFMKSVRRKWNKNMRRVWKYMGNGDYKGSKLKEDEK